MNGNTTLSETAQKALSRIRTLRTVSQKTGLQTVEEQHRVLMALNDADVLAVAEILSKGAK